MKSQPTSVGALFPEAVPPNRDELSKRAYKRSYIPKTYSTSDVDAAKRVIRHWNNVFRGLEGAYRANVGDACNVKAYIWMLNKCQKSEGEFAFDERAACAAITAYRNDQNNCRLGRWKRFRDWMSVESIDFYRSAIAVAQHRARQPKTARREKDQVTSAAAKIVRHRDLVSTCITAERNGVSVARALHDARRRIDSTRLERLAFLVERHASLDETERDALSARAREVFKAFFGRQIGSDRRRLDGARLEGIELALLDIGGKDNGRNGSTKSG